MKQPAKRKRRAKMASFIVCFVAASGIFVYGFLKDKLIEFREESNLSATKLAAIKNGTIKCYPRTEKRTYPVLLHFALGLAAIILGTFVDCSLLVVEEIYHFRSRYDSDIKKLWQACFSGLSWTAVTLAVAVIVILLTITFRNATYELTYLVIGIGVGPLVTHLLSPPTKSQVHVSTILDESQSHVGQILAWSYYLHYLDNPLSTFKRHSLDQGEHVSLSLDKLILLISLDCSITENLEYQDGTVKKLCEIYEYQFPVYKLIWNSKEYIFAIEYAKQPLETLYQMSQCAYSSVASQKSKLEYEVEFLYGTLS